MIFIFNKCIIFRAINRIKKLKAERRLKQSNAKKMQNSIKNKLLITIKNNEKMYIIYI